MCATSILNAYHNYNQEQLLYQSQFANFQMKELSNQLEYHRQMSAAGQAMNNMNRYSTGSSLGGLLGGYPRIK
jgi:hypothetical protein